MTIEDPRAGNWRGQIRNWTVKECVLLFCRTVRALARAAWWLGSTFRVVTVPAGCVLGLGGGFSWLAPIVGLLPYGAAPVMFLLDGNVPAILYGPVLIAAVGYVVVSSPPWWLAELERMDRRIVARFWRLGRWYPIRWTDSDAVAMERDSGEVVPNPIPDSHVLIAGTTGAGKSWAISALLWPLCADPYVHMVAIDLKRGMELGPWDRRLDMPVARTAADALDLLRAVLAFIDNRAEALEAAEEDDCPQPCAQWPHLVVVCDELARLMRFAGDADGLYTTAVEQGRACGVWFINAAQSPKADVIPTEFRDLHNTILCGASTQNMAGVITGGLGQDAAGRLGDSAPWKWDVRPRYRTVRSGWKRRPVRDEHGRTARRKVPGPDAGRFLLLDGGAEVEVRMIGHPKPEVRERAARFAHIAERPIVEPYIVSAEPTVEWLHRDLVAAARARGIPLPADVDNWRKYPKKDVLKMMGIEVAA